MQFNVSISNDPSISPDAGHLTAAERQAVLATMAAATTIWSWYLTSANVTLDVEIRIDDSAYSGTTLLEARPAEYYKTGTTYQGANVDITGSDLALHNGTDLNGRAPDILVRLTTDAIRNLLYFNPNVSASAAPYSVPITRYDALSAFMEEIGYGLGLASFSKSVTDPSFSTIKSLYDVFVDSNSVFVGTHAVAVATAGPVQLDPNNLSYLSNSGPYGNDLMATRLRAGTAVKVSPLDVAMLQDILVPIRVPTAADDVLHALGNTPVGLGDGNDTLYVDYQSLALDGGNGVDTAIFSQNKASYTISQTSTGNFTISGPDGTDTLTKIEYAQFSDQTVRLLPGSGVAVNFSASPSTYMSAIRDFDGNDLGAAGNWVLIGSTDVNHSGNQSHIYVNSANGRWAEVGTAPDGQVYFNDYSWAGSTRVVGIYVDPLVLSGQVTAGSANDSQRRFQNDLQIGNISSILGSGDYDGDGFQEVYFRLTDGTAYLHAYMWADGNIRYANYQSAQQVKDYLNSHGVGASTWGSWFPAADTLAIAPANAMMTSLANVAFDSLNQNSAPALAGVAF